jgi:hypothetical protein
MSKRCSRCEIAKKNKSNEKENEQTETDPVHDPSECPLNYLGSSKGMEAHGALKSCIHLHTHSKVVYEIIVMDDDSSTENILKWNFVDALEAKLIPSIPTTPAGNKKVDNGQLPLTHPPILRLADHNHRNRCMAGKFYNLARAAKKDSKCSTADAERLKRNMTYALHEYKSHDFATFKKMSWAVLYHHFNVHDDCGPWCRSLKYQDNPEELKKLHYRSKEEHPELYAQLLVIFETYCSDEALKEVHHLWHTNKCESINAFISKFVPKTKHLCRTIVGKARTYLAISLDSVGYEEYYRTLFELIDLEYDTEIMQSMHQRMDRKKINRTDYDLRPEVRKQAATARAIKIRENIRREYCDTKAGKTYGSGSNDPSAKANEENGCSKKKGKAICPFCQKVGHKTRRSKYCTYTTAKSATKKGKNRRLVVVV